MVKVLSQAGISLADTYDVEGSIAGIEQLQSQDVQLVHEMGGTIFSERLNGAIRRSQDLEALQSTTWDNVLTDLPATISRVLGCVVFTDVEARLQSVMVAIRDAASGREIPIFAWDTGEAFIGVRMSDDGSAVAPVEILQNALGIGVLPSMLIGDNQRAPVNSIAFRGQTTAFGAGDVTTTMLLYIAHTHLGGISSFGLPVPGW